MAPCCLYKDIYKVSTSPPLNFYWHMPQHQRLISVSCKLDLVSLHDALKGVNEYSEQCAALIEVHRLGCK